MDKIKGELKSLSAERDQLRRRWDEEKGILSELQSQRQKMEDYKIQAHNAERAGDYGKVAEIRYARMAEAQARIDELTARQAAIKDPIITEAVTPEDAALAEEAVKTAAAHSTQNVANIVNYLYGAK
jgi:ATP-dependent Clp protease ATP-binding subunit ClpB